MNKKVLLSVNGIIASLLAFLGYGCHSKKVVVEEPIEKTHIRDEIRLMYGPPSYFEGRVDTVEKIIIKEPEVCKYGVPVEYNKE